MDLDCIKITPAMKEAGGEVLSSCEFSIDPRSLAEQVYTAMARLAKCPQHLLKQNEERPEKQKIQV